MTEPGDRHASVSVIAMVKSAEDDLPGLRSRGFGGTLRRGVTEDANAGGAATAGGVDFQALVGAFIAVRALAETAVSPLWALPGDIVLTALRAEVAAAVDDLMLSTSVDGLIYIQAKTGVNLSDLPGSILGAAFEQFVRLYLAHQGTRVLDPTRDRIVLATAHTTGPLEILSTVLGRIRDLGTPARPEECVTYDGETQALDKAMRLVRHFWKAATNVEPTWLEMRPLLQLIWITRFQLEADGAEEQLAKILLRTVILHEPTQADAAWSVLRVKAIKLAKTRSGVNRAELQKTLITDQFHLRTMLGYEPDKAELKAHTRRSLRSLARFSRIRYDGHDVTILRSYEAALRTEAEAASLLVIGDAGCGKSGLLSVTAEGFVTTGRDVVVLNAGELGSNSLGNLRNELALKHDLIDVLEQWHGPQPAFLVIDALDSARDEKTQGMLRQLIEQVQDLGGRWRVVATIRKFDLRHGRNWRQIMPGKGIRPHYDPSFDQVRHLNVEKLSTDELDSIKDAAPDLHKMIAGAPSAVAELVRIPFNLMLANELRSAGAAIDLATITTQLQLLDLYWDRRLGSFSERGEREAVLASVANVMVKTRRLQVPTTIVDNKATLQNLLTDAVLVEQGDAFQFSHHILFDYAVERLLLRPNTAATITRLEADRDLAISIGPSLKYWLEGHWERDDTRAAFWNASLLLVSSNAPSIAQIVSGTVAAGKVSRASDAESLLAGIGTTAGGKLFGFAADAVTADVVRIAARTPNPWFEIIAEVAARGSAFITHRASYLLHSLLDVRPPTPEELVHAGRAARRMLAVAWDASPRFRPSVVSALRAVGRSFRSNVAESVTLLERALAPEHVKAFGHEELQWMVREVPQLSAAPVFLETLYEVTFATFGAGDQTTVMSNSQIFGLLSNAKQDIEAAQYELARQFPALAKSDIALAVRIAVRVANQYALRQSGRVDGAVPLQFHVLGQSAQFVPDPYLVLNSRDDELQIVDAAVTRLAALAETNKSRAAEMLRLVATANTTALMWRSLIEEAEGSQALFELLRPLFFEPAMLRSFTKQLVAWIRKYDALLDAQDRHRLEEAALALRDDSLGDVAAIRLLRAIGPDHLSPDAKDWLKAQDKAIKEQLAQFPPRQPDDALDDEIEDLVARGLPPADARTATNVLVRTRTKALLSKSQQLEKEPTADALDALESDLRIIRNSLDVEPVHPAVVASAWGGIAETATKLAILGRDTVRDILLEATKRPEPLWDAGQDAHFARGPSWGGGQARIEAVSGLLAIASRTDDEAVISDVRALAADPVAAVRYHVAQDSDWLAKRHPDLFWSLVETLIVDQNDGVVGGLFRGTIRFALANDRQRGIAMLVRVYEASLSSQRDGVIEDLFEEMLAQYVWTGDRVLEGVVNAVADAPLRFAPRLGHAVMSLRSWLTYPHENASPQATEVRQRAIAYVRRIVSAAMDVFVQITSQTSVSDAEKTSLRDMAKLLMEVAQELYFGSLGHDADEKAPDPEVRKRFYQEAKDLLGTLATLGLPAAAHYLVQTLASFIDLVDPVEVFLLLGTTVRAGRKGGYQYESLAVKEIVAIVQRYLADFRAIFVDNEECRAALRDILDTFVDAGWSETHRLVYSLDSIFK